jgi:hypothetical protein
MQVLDIAVQQSPALATAFKTAISALPAAAQSTLVGVMQKLSAVDVGGDNQAAGSSSASQSNTSSTASSANTAIASTASSAATSPAGTSHVSTASATTGAPPSSTSSASASSSDHANRADSMPLVESASTAAPSASPLPDTILGTSHSVFERIDPAAFATFPTTIAEALHNTSEHSSYHRTIPKVITKKDYKEWWVVPPLVLAKPCAAFFFFF